MTALAPRRTGRPLRFLGWVTSGWVAARIVLLWPQIDGARDILRAIAPIAVAQADAATTSATATAGLPATAAVALPRYRSAGPARVSGRRAADPGRRAFALLGLVRYGEPQPVAEDVPLLPGLPHALPLPPPGGVVPRPPPRWSGSVWLVARDGSGIAPGLGGQLGGSQAGVRVAYLVDRRHRIALAGRVTTPLGAGLREAAVGVEWQPTRLPLRLVAEERVALGDGGSGPALGVVGGIGPLALPLAFRLDGYGQAGVIRRDETQAYGDGAVRVAHPLGAIGRARVDLGAGLWGAAQQGAARLDIGPSLGVTLPLARQPVRLSLDWRERVAGNARPGSGPALSLGADF